MTDTTQGTWNDWIGADVVANDGDKIGTLKEVYMDRGTGNPEWLLVKTGMLGKSQFVPIAGAGADGDALKVPYAQTLVKDAPNVDDDDGFLSPEDEAKLYRHYGREDYQEWDDKETDVSTKTTDQQTVGRDTSGRETDDAMTRSEEELTVGTRDKETGRARLRKYIVTENVTTTVPVRKERVRLEREPITDANRDQALSGKDLSEEEHEVVLHEEEAAVGKEVVAKERIRLDKETVVENQQVSEDVRKEKIEVDDSTGTVRDQDRPKDR